MDILPAIDIRRGKVVRLSQGSADRQTVYQDDPHQQLEAFIEAGATWVHLVDLDRAFGDGENTALMADIARRAGKRIHIEMSGGLRSLKAIAAVADLPVSRFVLGTVAITEPDLIPEICDQVGAERIAVGLDARDGRAAIRGWLERSDQRVEDVARRVIDAGVTTIIYTDVARDGMLSGPDISGALSLTRLGASVIASGGVSGIGDVQAVAEAGLAGVIIGRALYEGKLTLEQALQFQTASS